MAAIDYPDSSASPWTDPNGQIWFHDGDGWLKQGTAILEAPIDGLIYGRKDAGWEEVKLDVPVSGYKNQIINGEFELYQRGTTFNEVSDMYTADRWHQTGIVFNTQQDNTDFPYSGCRWQADLGSPADIKQYIEAWWLFVPGDLWSFSFYSNSAIGVNDVQFGFLGSNEGSSNSTNATYDAGKKRVHVIVEIPLRSGTISAFYIGINTSIASFTITGVQFEKGAFMTELEHRPPGLEQLLAYRYYRFVTKMPQITRVHYNPNSDGRGGAIFHPVRMRAWPIITPAYHYGMNCFGVLATAAQVNIIVDIRVTGTDELIQLTPQNTAGWSATVISMGIPPLLDQIFDAEIYP